jgi:hypothetical protein
MISETHPAASWFLLLSAGAFLVLFALPLLLAPLAWARLFRWQLPKQTDLTAYFGRSLGAVGVAITVVSLRAAATPEQNAWLIDLVVLVGGLLTGVHVWGALTRAQPWTETAEIALFAGLTGLALWVRTTL